jgi:hypothetical protein
MNCLKIRKHAGAKGDRKSHVDLSVAGKERYCC